MAWTPGWGGLRKDLLAGLTVAAIAVPQAMAYALIAGVEPRIGLYTAIVMTAVASVFGSSSHLINGPTNAIAIVVFSALASFSPETPADVLEATYLLAIMVGVIQIGVALFRLGDLTRYVSESVVLGFMAGAGFLIPLTQLANFLGLQEKGGRDLHVLHRLWLTVSGGGPVNFHSLGIAVGTVVTVLVLRRLARRFRLPRVDMLLTVIAAAALTAACGWADPGPDGKSVVAVVGAAPAGLPAPHLPGVQSFAWVRGMSGSAAAIALLGLVEALAIAKSLAVKSRERLDYNRQCLAEGLANITGGFFQCMPGSGSLTRSAINYQAGGVSRWSGVFAAAAVALIVSLLAPLARYVPKASLAGLLFVTAAGLVDWPRLLYALRASRYDAGLVLATAGAAVFISVEFSLLIGVALSILLYVPRAARLQSTELVVADRVVRDRQPADPPCTGMALFDLEGELFFGAAPDLERVFDDLRRRAEAGARVIVLRFKRTRNPDMVCMERLQRFLQDMAARGVPVLLCGVREGLVQAMANLRFPDWLPADRVFREEDAEYSSTLKAVRRAYELLGPYVCAVCPRRGEAEPEPQALYYMI
jgi:sulfate permease, SulP family